MKLDLSFLKPNVNLVYLVQSITVVIVLLVTEHLTEEHFTCQCNGWSTVFVWLYFVMPAVGSSTFVWSLQQRKIFMTKSCSKCCSEGQICRCLHSWWDAQYPGLCWIVILLIDGKYAACGMYSNCDSTMTTVKITSLGMEVNILISKTIGFIVLAAIVLIHLIYQLWDSCCQSHEGRYKEMYNAQLEKDKEKLVMKYIKKCSENRAARYEREVEKMTKGILAGGGQGLPHQRIAESQSAGEDGDHPEDEVVPLQTIAESQSAGGGGNGICEEDIALERILVIIDKACHLKKR
ncbi:hypothetical protein COCON_G00045900 [Conger conger]|uniref:Uncharacterized protein n=1 Tax=Conger conger TaxID=82655 RepID=A0A9Q1DUP8_CONCO|nr:hypothetical protein COCON_G00045900 [Conger conger]